MAGRMLWTSVGHVPGSCVRHVPVLAVIPAPSDSDGPVPSTSVTPPEGLCHAGAEVPRSGEI